MDGTIRNERHLAAGLRYSDGSIRDLDGYIKGFESGRPLHSSHPIGAAAGQDRTGLNNHNQA